MTMELKCPRCGDPYMHQGVVRVYNRVEEDGPVFCVAVETAEHVRLFKDNTEANPSRRRQGLTIDMDCEQCGEVGRLAIYQHKGTTYVEWQE